MADPKVLRMRPSRLGVSLSWSAASLPAEVLAGSARRVQLVAWAFAALWASALVMNLVGTRVESHLLMVPSEDQHTAVGVIELCGLLLSLGMVGLSVALRERGTLLLDVGLIWLVLTAFCIALINYWVPPASPWGISWVAIAIIGYPAIVPNTPVKVLIATLLAASTDPLSMSLARLRGLDLPYDAYVLAWLVIPNYLVALIAVIPAHVISGLGRQVRQARELGSYKLGDRLGQGGMGEVYIAEHRLLARQAAIKVIRPELLGHDVDSEVAVERFKREAHAAASLRSPHTIGLYDFGLADDGTCYYVMELLDGVDGDGLVERFGPQPAERVAHLMMQACASLAEAHAQGLVHRDVKPSNMFVSRLGLEVDFVKVLDFGLVKVRGGTQAGMAKLTSPNAVAGTPTYMAPEVAMGEAPDARADVYALGCLAYWLLTGSPVFEADTPMKMMLRHINDAPVPPSQRSEFPEARLLDDVVLRCLAKRRDERPADAGELRLLLEAVAFPRPWTQARARRWWETNLPVGLVCGPCNRGELMPVMRASAS